jgi:hypothetical protein
MDNNICDESKKYICKRILVAVGFEIRRGEAKNLSVPDVM